LWSELDGRIDPKYNNYIYKYKVILNNSIKLGSLLIGTPMYGANESAVKYNGNCRYIRITDIDKYGILKDDKISSAENEEIKYKIELNDILIARSGATVGKSYIHEDDTLNAIFAGYMIRFKIDNLKVNPKYIFYFTQLNIYKQWTEAIQRSAGQPNINAEEYSDLDIPNISIEEQNNIVNIMNTAYKIKEQKEQKVKELLNSIDSYILEKLCINLPQIEDKKVTIINCSNLVGNRIDAIYHCQNIDFDNILSSSLYTSEILRNISILEKGSSIIKSNTLYGNIPVIGGGQVSPYTHNSKTHNGNVITISSSGAYAGYIWHHDYPIWASDCSVIYSKNELKINTIFLSYILKSIQKFFYTLQKGAGQPHVYISDFSLLKIPIPPINIQNEINTKIYDISNKAKQLQIEAIDILENTKEEVENIILGDKNGKYKI